MRCDEQVISQRTIRLSLREASRLVAVLGEMIQRENSRPEMQNLRAIHDRLDDASWLAQWLRDYVEFEVSPDEALDLIEVLVMTDGEIRRRYR